MQGSDKISRNPRWLLQPGCCAKHGRFAPRGPVPQLDGTGQTWSEVCGKVFTHARVHVRRHMCMGGACRSVHMHRHICMGSACHSVHVHRHMCVGGACRSARAHACMCFCLCVMYGCCVPLTISTTVQYHFGRPSYHHVYHKLCSHHYLGYHQPITTLVITMFRVRVWFITTTVIIITIIIITTIIIIFIPSSSPSSSCVWAVWVAR